VEELVDYKEVIGWVLGAAIAIVWISYGLLSGMMDYWSGRVFLVVAISLTILLGVLSGGVIALSKKQKDYKEVIGWVLGAAIAIVWVSFAILGLLGNMVFLVVAISLTILLGVLSGGLTALSKKKAKGS
jgi:hypothetical protein